MTKILQRTFRVLLWLTIVISFALIVINIVIARYPEKILSFFNIKKEFVEIGKINTVFFPFFIDVSNLSIHSDDMDGYFEEVRADVDLKGIFSSFLRLKISKGEFSFNKVGGGQKHFEPYFIQQIILSDIIVNGQYKDYHFTGNVKKGEYDSKRINAHIENVSIKNGHINEEFNVDMQGAVGSNIVNIEKATVRGKNIFILLNDLNLSQGAVNGNFSLYARDDILKLIHGGLSGEIAATGKFENSKLNAEANLSLLRFNDKSFTGKLNFNGDSKKFYFDSDNITFDNFTFFAKGAIEPEKKDISILIDDIKGKTFRFNNQEVFIEKAKLSGDYGTKKFGLNAEIFWNEKIVISSGLIIKDMIFLKDLSIKSKSIDVSGGGQIIDKNRYEFHFTGKVTNNPYLENLTGIQHELNTAININYDGNLKVRGEISTNKGLTYKKFSFDSLDVNFLLNNNKLSFEYSLLRDNNMAQGSGYAERSDSGFSYFTEGSYTLNLNSIYEGRNENIIGHYEIGYNKALEGTIDGTSNFRDRKVYFKSRIKNKKLIFSQLEIDNNKYFDIGTFEFDSKKINLDIDKGQFIDSIINLKNISLNINGSINDPEIFFQADAEEDKLKEAFHIRLNGKKEKLNLSARSKNAIFEVAIFPLKSSLEGHGTINEFDFKDINKLSGDFKFSSGDFKNIEIKNGVFKGLFGGRNFNIGSFSSNFNLLDFSVNNASFHLSTNEIQNLLIHNVDYKDKRIKGMINVDNASVNFQGLKEHSLTGDVKFSMDNESDGLNLYGNLKGKFRLYIPDYGVNLNDIALETNFKGKGISGVFAMNYLDSKINGSFGVPDFRRVSDSFLGIVFDNVFVNAANFTGTVKGYVQYSKNKLSGDVNIIKGDYEFKEFRESGGNKKIPFDIDLTIKSVNPVTTKNKYFDSKLSFNLRLKYNKELTVTGYLESTDSYLVLGGERFNILQGKLTLSEKKPPFLNIFSKGTGNYKYILLNIKGFLPEYSVEIRDISPGGAGFANLKSKNNATGNLIGDLFSGEAFANILSVTNKFFGINSIGIDNDYQSLGYFSIGRTFTDRLKVVYRLKSGEKGDEIVGYYTLFDWLNFNVISNNNGSNGAGFSIFYSF